MSDKNKKKPTSQEPQISIEYYQPIFALLHSQLQDSDHSIGKTHPVRESFWRLVPDGKYPAEWGREVVLKYLVTVEGELRNILSKHSLAYWLHTYRRLLPRPIGEDRSDATVIWVRSILEAAFQKYSALRLCNSVGVSGQIPDEKILNGLLLHPDLKFILEQLNKTPQLVLTKFDSFSLSELYNAEKLAYEIWKSGAILRSLGKGASFIVSKNPVDFFDERNQELNALLSNYDSRSRVSFDASFTGTVFFESPYSKSGTMFFPRYDVNGISKEIPAKFWRLFGLRFVAPFTANFLWLPVNFKAYTLAHAPFAEGFEAKNGVSLSSVFAVLGALALEVYHTWKNVHGRVLHYWRRGYVGPEKKKDIIALITNYLQFSISKFNLKIPPSSVDVTKVIEFLSLTQAKRDFIDVSLGGPHSIFIPYDDERVFIDYAWITETLQHLFYGVNLSDQNFKGDALESYVRMGESALPTKELKSKSGQSRQVDAAFAVGKLLVIAECKAKGFSLAMLRGDPVAIRHRIDLIDRALLEADSKARWLAENPIGGNFDVSGYSHILPLAVTPFVEFIPSLAAHYWIKPNVPRVLTADELRSILKKQVLKDCQNLVPIRKPTPSLN